MKLVSNAGELASALAQAELALDARIVIAILGCIHIQAGADGTVRLTVNALDRVISVTATAEVAEAGETVVRASVLAGLVKGFAKDAMVTVTADAQGAQVRCGRATYKLPIMPIDQLPPVPAIDVAAGEIELDRKELLEAIKQVAFAASTEETRYYMNGILFHDRDGRLALVATDGHRLAKCRIPSVPFSSDHSCIVSNATVAALIKLLGKTVAEDVRLRRSKALLELTAPGVVLTSKLIDGTFPDYERVIPAAPKNSVTVDHADLVAALTRLEAVPANEKNLQDLVGLSWDPAEPALHLSLPHQPGAADDVITATVAGDAPVQTAAQLRHIVELVDELYGKRVCIATAGAGNPILITETEDDATLVVQMPCRVSSAQSHAA
jgi:DNA polymerase-3 subunit beta